MVIRTTDPTLNYIYHVEIIQYMHIRQLQKLRLQNVRSWIGIETTQAIYWIIDADTHMVEIDG